jgi:hypothetical protein
MRRSVIGLFTKFDPGKIDKKSQVLVDVTNTMTCQRLTGIQRVATQLAKTVLEAGVGIPVFIRSGVLISFSPENLELYEVKLEADHKFVMADRAWDYQDDCRCVMSKISSVGGENII